MTHKFSGGDPVWIFSRFRICKQFHTMKTSAGEKTCLMEYYPEREKKHAS